MKIIKELISNYKENFLILYTISLAAIVLVGFLIMVYYLKHNYDEKTRDLVMYFTFLILGTRK